MVGMWGSSSLKFRGNQTADGGNRQGTRTFRDFALRKVQKLQKTFAWRASNA
jgi:hypothetical protein